MTWLAKNVMGFTLAISLFYLLVPFAGARGGGGGFGGGGFRGSFGGGEGRGDSFGRSFDDGRFGSDAGRFTSDGDRPLTTDSGRPDAFSRPYGGFDDAHADDSPHLDNGQRNMDNSYRSDDNGVHNYGDNRAMANTGISGQRSLATDGGFTHALNNTGFSKAWTHNNGNYTRSVSSAELATRGNTVRGAFNHYDAFTRNWWQNHPGAWYGRNWWNNWAWAYSAWPMWAGYCGWSVDDSPVYYDYGDNITYQGDQVYYGSQPTESADMYYQQAQQLAQSGPDPVSPPQEMVASGKTPPGSLATNEWKPLGVFSLVQGTQTDTTTLFQLAMNKNGKINGNYYNALTDETKPVKGSVDKKTKRVAWMVADKQNIVYDTGLANLLKDQSPILVHFAQDNTQQWTLVRLKQPEEKKS